MSTLDGALPGGQLAQADARPAAGLMRFVPLAGRILLASIFIMSGLGKVGSWEATAGYMAAKGMPMIPFFLTGAIALEVLGGVAVALGLFARVGAALLLCFLIPATLIFHAFWTFGAGESQMQMIMFMKNLSIMGGLLFVLGQGPGALSLDAWRARRGSA